MTKYVWTSEAVSSGHPDKVADQIADGVLDNIISIDKNARVACEVTLCSDLVLVTGEIGSKIADLKSVDVNGIVRKTLRKIGYDREEHSYNGNKVEIINKINIQSPEISNAVIKEDGRIGAGDQGIMFGFACDETDTFMPLCHHLSFEIINALRADIDSKRTDEKWGSPLFPDAKSQVSIDYENLVPKRVNTVVVSTCHSPQITLKELRGYVKEILNKTVIKKYSQLFDKNTIFYINPAGEWNVGGPKADTGLSGRKIVVDNYGGDCPIGGGSFSGKDPTKVDRSGAYAARYLAKNLVASGRCSKVAVQVSYAIGIEEPVSIRVLSPEEDFDVSNIKEIIDFSPKGIIDKFDLKRPIYQKTASGGHFGRKEFPWEYLDVPKEVIEKIGIDF